MYSQLDGPSLNGALSVTDSAVELKVGSDTLEERIAVTIQPLNGSVYYGFSNTVTSSNGTKIFKGQVFPLEAGSLDRVYLVADVGNTVDVRITERS